MSSRDIKNGKTAETHAHELVLEPVSEQPYVEVAMQAEACEPYF